MEIALLETSSRLPNYRSVNSVASSRRLVSCSTCDLSPEGTSKLFRKALHHLRRSLVPPCELMTHASDGRACSTCSILVAITTSGSSRAPHTTPHTRAHSGDHGVRALKQATYLLSHNRLPLIPFGWGSEVGSSRTALLAALG